MMQATNYLYGGAFIGQAGPLNRHNLAQVSSRTEKIRVVRVHIA